MFGCDKFYYLKKSFNTCIFILSKHNDEKIKIYFSFILFEIFLFLQKYFVKLFKKQNIFYHFSDRLITNIDEKKAKNREKFFTKRSKLLDISHKNRFKPVINKVILTYRRITIISLLFFYCNCMAFERIQSRGYNFFQSLVSVHYYRDIQFF